MEKVELIEEKQPRAHQIVESLLAKPSKKPDFASMSRAQQDMPSALKRVQTFLPEFITSTDKLLSMPLGQNKHDMDISIRQIGDEPMEEKEIKEPTGMTVSMVSNMIFLIE